MPKPTMTGGKKRINSCRKGKCGEREAAKFLTSIGFPAERNARNGLSEPDLIVPSLPKVHIEVKYGVTGMDIGTKLLGDACEQADSNAQGKRWAVLWKPTKKAWRLTYQMAIIMDTIPNATVGTVGDITTMLHFLGA